LKDGFIQHNINPVYLSLSVFYKWCKHAKIILANPFEGIKISNPRKEVIICDDHIVSQIMEFIKNPKSNPEQAFLLALILIWGLKSNDLSYAKIAHKIIILVEEKIFIIIILNCEISNSVLVVCRITNIEKKMQVI